MQKENCLNTNYRRIALMQRETFVSTINHDFKVPVLAQIRALELLIKEQLGGLNNGQREIINLTLESCRSMYKTMSELLSSYKYENNNIKLEFETINILNIVEN